MNIAVVCMTNIDEMPPALNVVKALLSLGHSIELVAYNLKTLPPSVSGHKNVRLIDLGEKNTGVGRISQALRGRATLRNYLISERGSIDLVWLTTDLSAREAGAALKGYRYVMQLAELVEHVPSMMNKIIPSDSTVLFKDFSFTEMARNASCVVVPEYNRAHIQKTWWNLDVVPSVLPNKPEINEVPAIENDYRPIQDAFENENRKVLLYQGVFTPDRVFEPFARAIAMLGDGYSFYLMGKAFNSSQEERIADICRKYANVHCLGFVPSPRHLSFTHYGDIGLLPYIPTNKGRNSVLNALYCAPNIIWEYSFFGLPMLGTDVPGLTFAFERYGLGRTVDESNVEEIAAAIECIMNNYDLFSNNCRKYYDSVDFTACVKTIIEKCSCLNRSESASK